MTDFLLLLVVLLLLALLAVQALAWRRKAALDLSPLGEVLRSLEKGQERGEKRVADEIQRNREELAREARGLREEVGRTLSQMNEGMVRTLGTMTGNQQEQLKAFSTELAKLAEANQGAGKDLRSEVGRTLTETANLQRGQLEHFSGQLAQLSRSNEQKMEAFRTTLEQKLTGIQEENARKLEEMRKTVDEKLEGTLERRLGESFRLVGERLEQVHKGLGEMQALAAGVGDLRKILTNVKTRGTWGEVQLDSLLEQILTQEQYARNVETREGSRERVEFAIRLPGRDETSADVVWLPIDAKFPKEDYERLVEASERMDADAVEKAARQLEECVRGCAKAIREKYLNPPRTTDFGIMFLASEGLYAEVLRRPGLVEQIHREYRVVPAGPTTIAALVNSLQMGFRSLAVQKQASQVWAVLGSVKTEFGRFGEVLGKVQKKLQEAGDQIDEASKRTRAIERKLRDVQQLPPAEAQRLLGGSPPAPGDSAQEES